MTTYPPLDPNFRNQYMIEVDDGPGGPREAFTIPAARAHRARFERPGLFGQLVQGARDVMPPSPWSPDRPKPELASPEQAALPLPTRYDTAIEYGSAPARALTHGAGVAGHLLGNVFGSALGTAPPARPVTGGGPLSERQMSEDLEFNQRVGRLGYDTALNMIGVGRLPGAAPPGSFGAGGGGAPTLRGAAGEQAWRTGTAEERLRTTNHPFGGGTPIRDMPKPIIEGAPTIKPKQIDVEKDLKNAELIFMPGDATGAGGRLLGFPGMTFENPVTRLGGPGYSYAVAGQPGPQRLWASDKGPMTGIYNVARGVEARGNVPWGVYMTGAKPYMDQSTQMVNTAIEAAKATGVSKDMNKHLVKVMRSDWNVPADKELLFPKEGLDNPSAIQRWLELQPMPQHAKLVKAMGTAEAEKLGFPNMSVLRVGNTDPRLLTAQPGSAGLMLGRIDTSKGLNPSYHPDYSTAIATDQLRTFGRQLPVDVIAQTMHAQRKAAYDRPGLTMYTNAPHKYYGAMGTPLKSEPVTNQWKDTVQNWLANNPEQKIGGVVLGAGANDARSVGLASTLQGLRNLDTSLRDPNALGGTVRVRTPQGTMNEIPEWMTRPRDFFPDMPGGVTIDRSLPMDVNSVMSRWAASPYQYKATHWTRSPVTFSQFKHLENVPGEHGFDFGIHAGTAGQAESRAYNRGAMTPPEQVNPALLAQPDYTYGQTYDLRVDPGPRGFIKGVEDSGTWGPIATQVHLEKSGKFTPQEIHRARTSSFDEKEILQNYRDLVRSKGYGGFEYANTGELDHGVTKMSLERDKLWHQALREFDYGKRRDMNLRADELDQEIRAIGDRYKKGELTTPSIAIADPSQIRVPGAMFNPANRGNPFILGAGSNDARSVALAAGLSAARDPQLGSTVRPIRAYHSSPHDFDRFDFSKIGTGEGAQAYGHGGYFAENPKVSGQGGQYWQQFKHRFAYNPAEMEAVSVLENHNFDREKAIAELVDARRYDAGYIGRATNSFDRAKREAIVAKNNEALKLLQSGKPVGPRTYEVNIHARPEQLVNYDAPLSSQPAAAQDLLGRLNRYDITKVGNDRWEVRHPGGWVPNAAKNFYRSEEAAVKAAKGLNVGRTVPDLLPRNAEQARSFVEAGIPGIRYLDARSRPDTKMVEIARNNLAAAEQAARKYPFDAGHSSDVERYRKTLAEEEAKLTNQTYNYVMFPGTEGIIEIAKKYGIPGMLGAGALGSTVAPDRYGRGS